MKKIFLVLSFVLPLIIYILTLAPDVYFTDSGELASVANTLGIAHPTGYPLFTLVGYSFSNLLPWSPIFNLNVMAAVFTSGSALFLYLTILMITNNFRFVKKVARVSNELDNYLLSLFITLGYSYALTTWQQATSVEVYSLQLFLINLFLFILLKAYYSDARSDKYLILSGFILGLGFANHLTSFMLIPAGLIIFFSKTKKYERNSKYKLLSIVVGATLIGVLLYLYLPLRSAQSPVFNWGEVHRSYDKFMYHVTGAQYQVWMFSGDESVWKDNVKLFFNLIPAQITWIGILFLFYGVYISFRGDKVVSLALSSTAVLCVFYSMNYSIHDIDSYFVTAYIVLAIIVAIAAKQLVNHQNNLVYLFAFIPLFNLFNNYSDSNLSEDDTVSEYHRIVTESAEKDAIIISAQWDFWVSAFWYKDKVEGNRSDISLIEKELLRRTWYVNSLDNLYPDIYQKSKNEIELYQDQLEKFESELPYDPRLIQSRYVNMINSIIDEQFGKRPIYLTFDVLQSEPDIAKSYVKIPEGFLIKLSKTEESIVFDYSTLEIDKLVNSVNRKDDELHRMSKQLALVNLNAALNYSKYKNDKKSFESINKLISIIKKVNE